MPIRRVVPFEGFLECTTSGCFAKESKRIGNSWFCDGKTLLCSPSLLASWSCLRAPFMSTAELGHVRLLVNDNTADFFASLCGTKGSSRGTVCTQHCVEPSSAYKLIYY